MKLILLAAVTMLATIPTLAQDQARNLAQDQASCKAYFQVLQGEAGTPGLRAGLDSAQKKWWEDKGRKQYPGLCLSGSVTSADKPRYLVIWMKSKTIGPSSIPPNDAYGQPGSALQAMAPATKIYQSRWDQAAVTVVNVQNDGSLMLPPIYFEAHDHTWILFPSSRKALEEAVKYLSQEQVFTSKPS